MNKLDFKTVAEAALNAVDNLLAEWLPGGKYKGAEFFALNPTRADKSLGSFAVNTHSGAWADYATDDRGGDLISLYAYLFTGGNQGEALKAVAERVNLGGFEPVARVEWCGSPKVGARGERNKWTPIVPFDEACLGFLAGSEAFSRARNGRAQGLRSVYRDEAGRPLMVVQRFLEADGGKSDYPFSWCRNEEGVQQWKSRRVEAPYPLFGLDELAARPNARVLVVEGEKCKQAAASAADLADFVAISWVGGCKGWKKSDFSPLAGREVLLWADCDSQRRKPSKKEASDGLNEADMPYLDWHEQPGMAAMLGVADLLHGLGCAVKLVNIPEAGTWPNGYDVADLLADERPPVALEDLLDNAALLRWPLDEATFSRYSQNESEGRNAPTRQELGGAGADFETDMALEDEGYEADVALLKNLLENYAQIGEKERALNLSTGETLSFRQLAKIYGKNTVDAWQWQADKQKLLEAEADLKAKKLKLETLAAKNDELKNALERYIYLDGTTEAFDSVLDMVVPLSAVKSSIYDEFDDWMKAEGRLVCAIQNYVFEPALPQGISFDDEKRVQYINMFKGLPVAAEAPAKPTPADMPLADLIAQFPACKHIIGLFQHLTQDNGQQSAACLEWVLNWLACRFRWPHKKPATAIVFISEVQGVGKSTLGGKVLKGLFGKYYRKLNQDSLESKFNAPLVHALMTTLEEISPSDERKNVIGKFKDMITAESIMIERKGKDPIEHADYNAYMVFSNDEKAVPIETNDRRFMVLEARHRFTDAQYLALETEIDNGGLEEFARFLCALPLMYTNDQGERCRFTPHAKPIKTRMKTRMINASKPSWEAFIDDWWAGELGAPFVTCAAKDLWALYSKWCKDTKTFSMTQRNFYAGMGKRFGDLKARVIINGFEKRLRIFIVPHAWLKEADRARYPEPTTTAEFRTSGDEGGQVTKAAYWGRQCADFNEYLRSTQMFGIEYASL